MKVEKNQIGWINTSAWWCTGPALCAGHENFIRLTRLVITFEEWDAAIHINTRINNIAMLTEAAVQRYLQKNGCYEKFPKIHL